jgi:hypothetical protein
MDGDLTLSCDFAPEYRFESRAEWPEGVNFDGIIRDTVAEEFVRKLGALPNAKLVLERIGWHEVDSSQEGFRRAAVAAVAALVEV